MVVKFVTFKIERFKSMGIFNLKNLSLSTLKSIEVSEYESYQGAIHNYNDNPTPENLKTWDKFESRYLSLLEEIYQREEFKDLQ